MRYSLSYGWCRFVLRSAEAISFSERLKSRCSGRLFPSHRNVLDPARCDRPFPFFFFHPYAAYPAGLPPLNFRRAPHWSPRNSRLSGFCWTFPKYARVLWFMQEPISLHRIRQATCVSVNDRHGRRCPGIFAGAANGGPVRDVRLCSTPCRVAFAGSADWDPYPPLRCLRDDCAAACDLWAARTCPN